MHFELDEEQLAFKNAAAEFAARELRPQAAKWDRDSFFPVEVLRKAGSMGFMSLYIPEVQGGLGLSRLTSMLIFEQLAMGCTATTAYMTIHNMVGWIIAGFGGESLKKEWCPGLASGQQLGSYCLTESGAGSDAAALQTSATLKGAHYVINGTKCFISGAGSTDLLIVMARTGGSGAAGISAFAVPSDTPGITFGRREDKMGWNCQPTRTINFDSVCIPKDNRLGEEGSGFKIAMKALDGGRVNIATCSVGTAQQALNETRAYMLERRQFKQPLAEFQGLQFKLADMAIQLTAAKSMVQLAASKLDQSAADATVHCAMAKKFATDAGFTICNDALQIFGGYGYIKDYPVERYVRDTRVHQILEGTNEIMRLIIARHLINSVQAWC